MIAATVRDETAKTIARLGIWIVVEVEAPDRATSCSRMPNWICDPAAPCATVASDAGAMAVSMTVHLFDPLLSNAR